ncbi:MAG TPA: HDOD domain-containing protein [Bryobacteraceae bacterium]|nr:HDOD domain-containing protein [Bryobacteraceae bacterium]
MTRSATKPIAGERNRMLEPGAQAHCKRVAAWCEELSLLLEIPGSDASALQEAALMHHHPIAFLQGAGYSKLAEDLGFLTDDSQSAPRLISMDAEQILQALFAKRGSIAPKRARDLAHILELANCFDEQLEFAPFECDSLETVLQRTLERHDQSDRAVQFVLRYLRKAKRSDLAGLMSKLPVYPAVAMKLYKLLTADDVSLPALDQVAKSDQVVAGKMLQAANSAFYSPRQLIKTVSQAISYVGVEDSRRILMASAIQPLYSSARLQRIWQHAIEAAQVTEQIAKMSRKVDPAEAFLVGLLHDVGKLAIALMPGELNSSLDRLVVKGCESAVAEVVVCGFDHAEAGADVLKHWKFSDELIAAVRYHHMPEKTKSPMAGILYLTEFWTDIEEDIPSNARLDLAFELSGITPADLSTTTFEFNEALAAV